MDEDAVYKDLPYFKAIWKTCLKKQIGSLLEELSRETGEESVIVMANASTGTAVSFGSANVRGFVDTSMDFKMQFLSYCMKNSHTNKVPGKSVKRKQTGNLKSKHAKKAKLLPVHTATSPAGQVPVIDDKIETQDSDKVKEGQPQEVSKMKITDHFGPDLRDASADVTQENENKQEKDEQENCEADCQISDISQQGPTMSDLTQAPEDMDSSQSESMVCIKTEQPDYDDYSVSQESDASTSNACGESFGLPLLDTQGSMSFTGLPGEFGVAPSIEALNSGTPQPVGPIRFLRKFPPKERTHLSLPAKIQIIQDYESGAYKSQRELADRYNISKTAVGEMIRNKEILKSYYEINANTKRKRFSTNSKFGDINEVVWQWFKTARQNGVQMSGPMIQEKALQVAQELHVADFKGSNGWLHSWKSRYNVTSFKDGSVGMSKEHYINDYSKIEGYTPTEDQKERTNSIMNFGIPPVVGSSGFLGDTGTPDKSVEKVGSWDENETGQAEGKPCDVSFQDTINRILQGENIEPNAINTSGTNIGQSVNSEQASS